MPPHHSYALCFSLCSGPQLITAGFPLSHSLSDNCQTTSLFPRIGLSYGISLELSSREGGILFHTIVPPHSLGSQYDVCSLSVAIPVTHPVVLAYLVANLTRW